MPKRTRNYTTKLHQDLQDPIKATHYLIAAFEDSEEMFRLALQELFKKNSRHALGGYADGGRHGSGKRGRGEGRGGPDRGPADTYTGNRTGPATH